MGHHIDDQGRFQSDKYPDLKPDKVVIDLTDRQVWDGLWLIAWAYRHQDDEFACDLQDRVRRLRAADGVGLNGRVTEAILNAEALTRLAALAWKKVTEIEEQLSHEDRDPLLRDVATRGIWTAAMASRVLAALDRYQDAKG